MGQFKKITIFIAVAFVLAALPGPAQADLITFNFSGHVTSVFDNYNELDGSVAVGTPFSGQYTFDSAWPHSDTDPNYRNYSPVSPTGVGMSVSVGNYHTQSVSTADQDFFISVADNWSGEDCYDVNSMKNVPTGSLNDPYMFFSLEDYSQTALSSLALPLTPPDLSAWTSNIFWLWNNENEIHIEGSLETLTMEGAPVPVPGTLVLLLSGLAGLGLYRRLRP